MCRSVYCVAAINLNTSKLTDLNNKYYFDYPDQIATYQCDVTDNDQLTDRYNQIFWGFKRINCVVNNAGVHPPVTSMTKLSVNDFKKNFDINLVSNYTLCQLAVPKLKKNRGTIVLVSSLVALIGQNNYASKDRQLGLMKSLAIELAPEVRVNGVAPSNEQLVTNF